MHKIVNYSVPKMRWNMKHDIDDVKEPEVNARLAGLLISHEQFYSLSLLMIAYLDLSSKLLQTLLQNLLNICTTIVSADE